MKKIMLFIIMIMMFMFTINVYATNAAKECKVFDSNGNCDSSNSQNNDFFEFKTQYEKGIQKTTINGSGIVTLYGYSSCQTGSCTYKYANTSPDFKEVLKQTVVCGGGESNIIYQTTGGADGYKSDNSENYVGDVYWSEDFSITCTNNSSSSTITLNNSTPQSTTHPTTNPNNNDDYNSSDTTPSEKTGVETYYIVLGIVGIITYLFTIVVKKQNLFKKV